MPPSARCLIRVARRSVAAAYLSTKLNELRVGATNSVTVAAGDLIGGSPFLSGLFHDEPSVETLEAMKLTSRSVGTTSSTRVSTSCTGCRTRLPSGRWLLLPERAVRRRVLPVAGRQRDLRGDWKYRPAAHVDQAGGGGSRSASSG